MLKIILIILAIIYVLSPYDLLSDFLIGWGWLDDLLIAGLLWRFLYTWKKKTDFFKGRSDEKGYHGQDDSKFYDGLQDHSEEKDPYKILGLDMKASQHEIKKAYRQLANTYHPDKVSHLGDEFRALAEKRFKEIQQAYEKLSR